jgi:multidrug efflux pump
VTISASVRFSSTLSRSLACLEKLTRKHLPSRASISYSGESNEFKESSGHLHIKFIIALLLIYLVLAAQFESFVHPMTMLLSVPPAIEGAYLR